MLFRSIDGSGVLSATYSYSLPAATTNTLGGVIVGTGLSVTSGTVSANVTSVAGRTGAVTIAAADVSGLGSLATQSSVAYSSLTGTPSTFAPSAHAHGNITNAGAIGSTSGLPIITTTSGVLTTGTFGTTSGTFCQGNDSRLSDSRTPTSHASTHASGGADALSLAASQITSGTVNENRLPQIIFHPFLLGGM